MDLRNELNVAVEHYSTNMEAIEKALNFENEKFDTDRLDSILKAIKELRRTIAHLMIGKIHPDALYPVNYKINECGEKEFGQFKQYGRFLTENQIIALALRTS